MAIGGLFKSRNLLARKRLQKRHSVRRALLETLEARQLLAVGPQLIGVQPNAGELLSDGEVLNVSPSELLFRFNDGAGIDPNSLGGIRVIRSGEDGVFERASVASDLGTSGQALVEFYAATPGQGGNGIELRFTAVSRTDSRLPVLRVTGRKIDIEVNSNPALATRVEDLLRVFDRTNNTQATNLVFAQILRGSRSVEIGRTVDLTRPLVLSGANAGKGATNFGLTNDLEVRFVARDSGNSGLGIVVNVTRRDPGGASPPVVTVNGKTINVEVNSNSKFATTAREFVDAINNNAAASALVEAQFVSGVPATRIGLAPVTYSPIQLSGISDIEVVPAYIGLGDSDREVVLRFAETLPDDHYRVEILGQGVRTLRNVNGDAFNAGISQSIAFELDLGVQVVSVVPQPVTRDPVTGALSWDRRSEIDVYFSHDKLIDIRTIATVNGLTVSQLTAERGGTLYLQNSDTIVFNGGGTQHGVLTPAFYQLINSKGTLNTGDDDAAVLPTRIRYYPNADRVSLKFAKDLDQYANAGGELRLRVGTNESRPAAPIMVDGLTTDPADTFAGAQNLGTSFTPGKEAVIIDSKIENTSPLLLDFPGGSDEPGNRQIRMQDNLRLGADNVDGISTIFYNFQGQLGTLNGSTLLNAITEQQRARVREVLSLYEQYLGVRFVESQNLGMTIAVGDMRAVSPFPDIVGGPPGVVEPNQPGFTAYEAGTLISNGQPATVLDVQDFSSSTANEFGGTFTRAAMQAIGKLLGLGDADELEQLTVQSFASVFALPAGTEIVLPGNADVIHGQYLYRPDSKDIDLYRFTLPTAGRMTIEAFAERMSQASLLDSNIRLYQQTASGGWEEIAANDDYFSSDSFLELELAQGNYIVGVSASGNGKYDPSISDSGIGGRSQGSYQLRMDFQPPAPSVMRDADSAVGTQFDGDADGNPGGVFNFWFRPSAANTTKFVDKAAVSNGNGSIATPYKTIAAALAAAVPGDVVRIVGNGGADKNFATQGDNLAYEIGFDSNGSPLSDGATFDVPKDVSVVLDAGAILKLRRARIGVGSTSVNVDRSGGSLLVLGTPTLQTADGRILQDAKGLPVSGNVIMTSLNETGVGKNTTATTATVGAGDWGGIDFRNRVDNSNGRNKLEKEGLFLNWVSNADIRYGGGQVVIDGTSQSVTPIQMVDSRPSVLASKIARSADAAMSATPNSFLESNFHSPAEQFGVAPFSVDYDRVGPDLHGNQLLNNSINGLQVRVRTSSATQLEKMTVQGRFDDTDIVHFIPENLEIQGTPGGALQQVASPGSTRVALTAQAGGALAAGRYNYRFTALNGSVESPGSEPTSSLSTGSNGSIVLSNIPPEVRRIYRSAPGGAGPYTLVGVLSASAGTFVDSGANLGATLSENAPGVITRQDARLVIDPGTVLKSQGARIDVSFGSQLIAEGTEGKPVVFTSLDDIRYGAGGTFNTANRANPTGALRGDWGGIYVGHTSSASLDHAVVAYGGGTTRVEGGFSDFGAVEVHQGDLRIAHSRLEFNANGATTSTDPNRGGRGTNTAGTIFVRGAQPIIVDNIIRDNNGAAITANVSALDSSDVDDPGRSRGSLDRVIEENGNQGPLVRGNRLDGNAINGMVVRGGPLTSEGVWDDTDIVHVVLDEILVPDFHAFGGLRLESSLTESLVVKLQSGNGTVAGLTATGKHLDNADRIGGSIQVIGMPGQPVILTALADSTVGAGFTPGGDAQRQTIPSSAGSPAAGPAAGAWRSILLDPRSNDRNVAAVTENESAEATNPNSNGTPSRSQFLGGLAPNEKSGDENRRLGYEIHGSISAPTDVDVYSFEAQAGTEVWLDIDRTNNSLDTIVELVDANGRSLALSDDSLREESDPSLLQVSADLSRESVNPLRLSTPELYYKSATGAPKDLYSTNPRDAGFRVSLPGASGSTNLYHVRVRSAGQTEGSYQLQIRLSEVDEVPGSSLKYADIRYAQTGIQLVGVPSNSPLLGENSEVENKPGGNNSFANAQALGNLLQTNRQALSVAGNLNTTTDVDWFSFDIDYQSIRPTSIREYFSTIFDVDYANGIGRPDTSVYVFDAQGRLILNGLGSDVVDDQASPLNAAGNSDLSRGSAGSLDPYIGSYELPAGTYFVAVTNSSRMPAVMTQFTDANSNSPLVRLQPIEGIRLIAEEHVDFNGGSTAANPIVPDLFTSSANVNWGLGDIVLYVSRDAGSQTDMYAVNPFTGEVSIPFNNRQPFDVEDIAFRSNGELRAFDRALLGTQPADLDAAIDYFTINTGTGAFTAAGSTGLQTFHRGFDNAGNPIVANSDDGVHPEAITFANIGNQEYGFFVGNRLSPTGYSPAYDNVFPVPRPAPLPGVGSTRPGPSYYSNILYEFDENSGAALGTLKTGNLQYADAGTAVTERAYIETRDLSGNQPTRLVARETTRTDAGVMTRVLRDGDQFILVDRTGPPLNRVFEFDLGPEVVINSTSGSALGVRDGMQFTLDGVVYELDTGSVVVVDALTGSQLADGSTVRIHNGSGVEHVFEFDSDGSVGGGNIAVAYKAGDSQAKLAQALVTAVNLDSPLGVRAEVVPGSNRISFLNASSVDPIVVTGSGLSVEGNLGITGDVRIPISEAARARELVGAIAAAMPNDIVVSYEAGRLNFSGAAAADFGDLRSSGIFTVTPAVNRGGIPVNILANDTAETVARRIADTINGLGITGFSASTNGDQIQLFGATISSPGPLASAGIAPGGIVTGIAVVGNTLFAVSDEGGLYRVNNPQAAQGVVQGYVSSSHDLLGIRFTGLVAGPSDTSLTGGEQVLFGIDNQGEIYAFNLQGQLRAVFANGATSIRTQLGGANGLALSTLQRNLWSTTNVNDNTNRENNPGHGLLNTPNSSRGSTNGNSSYYFGDNGAVNFNFPGGAAGAMESATFSLAGLSASDLPTLYFNYFLETENTNGFNMEDAFRVYASGEDGSWRLLATNNSDTRFELSTSGDVQELFDNTGSWRQARVPLDRLAGQENVKLRVEFSTGGGFGYGRQGGQGPEIRTKSGDRLADGQTLFISGQQFEIDMGPTLTLPGGSSLKSGDSITIEGVRYFFTDGTGPSVPGSAVAVPFTATSTAAEIAAALQTAVQNAARSIPVVTGLNFSEDNDVISRASQSGVNGDTVRVIGRGSIGDRATNADRDVDMIRIDVDAGANIVLRANSSSIGSALNSFLRLFDTEGRQVASAGSGSSGDSTLTFVSPEGGTYFIGVSGAGNQAYDAVIPGITSPGSTGDYELQIEVQRPLTPIVSENRLQLVGAVLVSVGDGTPIQVQGTTGTTGIPVRITADMTAQQVAIALQRSVASYFANGRLASYPVRGGDTLSLTGLNVTDSGPFGLTNRFEGDVFTSFNLPGRAQANNFEGVYVDDFIIGVASRGEMVLTPSNTPIDTNFVANPNATNQILTGPYQFEIRGGDEYGRPTTTNFLVQQTFDADARAASGLSIRFKDASQLVAGSTFTVGDGPRVVTFEMDDVNDGQPVAAGNVSLPFNTAIFNSVTGGTTSESAEIIAARFRDLLNSAALQSQLNVAGNLVNNDPFGATSDTVVLIGNATASVPASIGQKIVSNGKGASNRERPQGQIVVNGVRVRDSLNFGISVDASPRDPVTNAPLSGAPRNTVTLNTERLATGAVIMNSELLFNGAGGISVTGDAQLGSNSVPSGSVPFVRLVNNTIVGGTVTQATPAPTIIAGDQIFELGTIAFADSVVSYNPQLAGGPGPIAGLDQPNDALGAPNYNGSGEPQAGQGAVSLGSGGQLIVQFTDNLLTGSGDASPDLMIFEVGNSERVNVAVSTDGVTYTSVGVASGASPKIDLDAFGFNRSSRLAYVRLTDVVGDGAATGDSVGADIDAVGAISSVRVENFQAGGTGISVTNNATATLLNNVIVNSATGINVDASSSSTIIGGTVFQRNGVNVAGAATLGQFPSVLPNSVATFESIASGNLYPAMGSPVIDSSIDSLEDRPSLVAVKEPLGLSASPILTPDLDINGQLRVDDPNVETPAGLGENVFKDRGAQDRADFAGPSLVLLNPADNDFEGLDSNPADSIVELSGVIPRYFDIQIVDGLEPSDPNRGSGVDDSTVNSSSVLVFGPKVDANGVRRQNQPLVEGQDYRFGYDSTNGTIRLTPLAGIWEPESVYTIRFLNRNQSAFVAQSTYTDGTRISVVDATGTRTNFELDYGYLVTVPSPAGATPADLEGATFAIDDGARRLVFEFDVDGSVASGNQRINLASATTAESIARLMENAIELSGLNVTVDEVGPGQLQIQGSRLVQFDADTSGLVVTGQPGVQTAFGLQIPLQAGSPDGITDGQTFTIDRINSPVTFELDTNGVTQPGNTPIRFPANATTAQIATAIVNAIRVSSLGLNPVHEGDGFISLGGDATTRLDLSGTVITQTGIAGQPGAVRIPISAAAAQTSNDVARSIKQAIDAQNLPGVVTTLFGDRVLIEGSQGVAGAGATPVLAIRDLAGNPLKANQADGSTTVTIFLGEGLDYGDAPAPYQSANADNGPRHEVINGLSLGASVTSDADAKLDDMDSDDGVTFSNLFAAFQGNAQVAINNTTGKTAYVSLWIDFNGDGIFTAGEQTVTAQPVSPTQTSVNFAFIVPRSSFDELTPQATKLGDTYARVRLSTNQTAVSSPVGFAPDGEVEDHLVSIKANPFQNVNGVVDAFNNSLDVSGDGAVSAIDVLQVINWINDPSKPNSLLLSAATGQPPYVDVNGDGQVSAQDTLILVNYINSRPRGAGAGEGEGEFLADELGGHHAARLSGEDVVLASNWAVGLENVLSQPRPDVRNASRLSPSDEALLQNEDEDAEVALPAARSSAPSDEVWAEMSRLTQDDTSGYVGLGDDLLEDLLR